MRRRSLLPILLVVLAAPAEAQQQTPGAVFTRYCVTCHNATTKVAGLVIDPAELSNVAANPELWEKVVRKLRSSAMPPVNAPRPDQATYESVAHVPRDRARSCGGREAESGQNAAAASAEPHRVSERRPRSARARRASAGDGFLHTASPGQHLAAASTTSRTCSSSRRQRWSATWTPREKSAASRSAIPGCRRWSTFTGCLRSTGRTRGLTSCRLERAAASRSAALSPSTATTTSSSKWRARAARRTSSRSPSTASART